MNSMRSGLDWSKDKTYQIKKRGNLSLLATAIFKNGNFVSSGSRCVWPTSLESRDSKIISRRVWSKAL